MTLDLSLLSMNVTWCVLRLPVITLWVKHILLVTKDDKGSAEPKKLYLPLSSVHTLTGHTPLYGQKAPYIDSHCPIEI